MIDASIPFPRLSSLINSGGDGQGGNPLKIADFRFVVRGAANTSVAPRSFIQRRYIPLELDINHVDAAVAPRHLAEWSPITTMDDQTIMAIRLFKPKDLTWDSLAATSEIIVLRPPISGTPRPYQRGPWFQSPRLPLPQLQPQSHIQSAVVRPFFCRWPRSNSAPPSNEPIDAQAICITQASALASRGPNPTSFVISPGLISYICWNQISSKLCTLILHDNFERVSRQSDSAQPPIEQQKQHHKEQDPIPEHALQASASTQQKEQEQPDAGQIEHQCQQRSARRRTSSANSRSKSQHTQHVDTNRRTHEAITEQKEGTPGADETHTTAPNQPLLILSYSALLTHILERVKPERDSSNVYLRRRNRKTYEYFVIDLLPSVANKQTCKSVAVTIPGRPPPLVFVHIPNVSKEPQGLYGQLRQANNKNGWIALDGQTGEMDILVDPIPDEMHRRVVDYIRKQ